MARRDSIQRINYIVDFLRKKPATFEEILNYLDRKSMDDGFNFSISQKTFKRDLELILDTLHIEIEFSHSLKKYKIVQEEKEEIDLRMMESYDTFNALKIAKDITEFIFFEKRKGLGTEYMSPIIFAIRNRKLIRCSYQKFWDSEANNRLLIPLALKENKQRWYLVAIDNKDQKLKTFGLDRISNLLISDQGFTYPKDINIEQIFENCFGIINDEDYCAEEIVLSFSKHQAKYIKSLPLHHSQEIIFEDAKDVRIKLFVKPTFDFMMEILSHGQEVQIIEPAELRKEMKKILSKTLSFYK
ncbi:MAG: WYL domain-containing protein [Flavobacteriia bacterium]|nr:WYL domain-containing protein [Flavobacteriia bacterium]